MKQTQKQWLGGVPWESVVTVNKALCVAQKLDPTTNLRRYDQARRQWEAALALSMSLKEVLEVCRECHELTPFTFNNGNTFAAVGRTLIEDWLKTLPPVESQVIRNTVGHYIVGLIGRKELVEVLRHFERTWRPESTRVEAPLAPVHLESQVRA